MTKCHIVLQMIECYCYTVIMNAFAIIWS